MHYRMLLALMGTLAFAACAPIEDSRGHNTDEADFKQIIPNQSTEADVRAVLGTPSATSSFGQQTWYYITTHKETVGPLAPEITAQHVYAVRFNESKIVTEIGEYQKEDSKPVQYVSKSTPTEGNEITFIQQIFGNFGRFNPAGSAINPRGIGR